MLYKILLLGSICFFTNCANKMLLIKYDNENVKLVINPTKEITSDSINITVSFENNTANDFYLLNKEDITTSDNSAYVWILEVLFQDTIRMVSPVNFLSSIKLPTEKDYFLLKKGSKYIFSFNIHFRELVQKPSEFGKLNENYGKYSVKLIYKDPFCTHKNAFREEIESNVIRLLYKNNKKSSI